MQQPGWAELLKIQKQQTNNRRGKYLLEPLEGTDKLTQQQFELGEAAGMEFILGLPDMVINAEAERLVEMEAEIDETLGDEHGGSTPD